MLKTEFDSVISTLVNVCESHISPCNKISDNQSAYKFELHESFGDMWFTIDVDELYDENGELLSEHNVIHSADNINCTAIRISGFSKEFVTVSLLNDKFIITEYNLVRKPPLATKIKDICTMLDKDVPTIEEYENHFVYLVDYKRGEELRLDLGYAYCDENDAQAMIFIYHDTYGIENGVRIYADDIEIIESGNYYILKLSTHCKKDITEIGLRRLERGN